MGSAIRPILALERPRRIAVLRALQLGDLLCAVPAFRALRAGLPDSEVVLVGLPWAREFADRFAAYVDGFLELPGFPGLPEVDPDVRAIATLLAAAQAREFDVVLQLHGSGEISNQLALLLGGRQTAGFYRRDGYCPDPATFFPYPEEGPEPRRLLQLVEALGLPARGEHLEFPVRERDHAGLAAIPEADVLRAAPYVVVHPGARFPFRRWDPVRFAEVADALSRQGLSIVLTGSTDERAVAKSVVDAMRSPAISLAGRTSLGALAALVERAALVVCNDTGVSHLAAALRVPSVVVFTTSDAERWAPLDIRRHRAVKAAIAPRDAVLREAEEVLRAG